MDITDITALADLATKAETTATNFSDRTDRRLTDLAEAPTATPQPVPDNLTGDERAIIQRHNARTAAQQQREAHQNMLAHTREERDREMAQAGELIATADALDAYYDSPASMLKRTALGDARRANLQTTLAGAGPAELRTYVQDAIARRDVVLAAAAAAALDRLPNADRTAFRKHTGHSVAGLGERFMGEPYRNARAAGARLRLAAKRIVDTNRAFEHNTHRAAVTKIASGLMQRRVDRNNKSTKEA